MYIVVDRTLGCLPGAAAVWAVIYRLSPILTVSSSVSSRDVNHLTELDKEDLPRLAEFI